MEYSYIRISFQQKEDNLGDEVAAFTIDRSAIEGDFHSESGLRFLTKRQKYDIFKYDRPRFFLKKCYLCARFYWL